MRYLLTSVAFFLVSSAAFAGLPVAHVPSPEMDFGLAGLFMVAGAAFLARRRRG